MKALLLVFLLSGSITAQHFNRFIFTESIIIPSDLQPEVYFTFKIPYQNLVFEKESNSYKAGLRLYLEITDTNSSFIRREIKDWNYSVNSFEETNSAEILAEGLLKFNLDYGHYFVLPIITDKNTHHEFKLERVRMDISEKTGKYLKPVITYSKKTVCNENNLFRFANLGGKIPFDKNEYNIIIPVTDISLNAVDIIVISMNDTVFSGKVDEVYDENIKLFECGNKIFLNSGDAPAGTKNFLLSGLSSRFREGSYTILINGNKEKIPGEVLWYNKPLSLRKPEFAIKALKHIEPEDTIDSLLKEGKQNQYNALINFWKKKDPTPGTEYNELMVEYYSRIDYAEKNFVSLNGKNGWDTDRGMIYVKFGKPGKVERSYNDHGKVIETWIYEQANRRFVFIDKQGIGEFSLESS
jgi:GWxTD domain-containing protein